eukprot:5583095-Heterocapsa_arctica.AAC.1
MDEASSRLGLILTIPIAPLLLSHRLFILIHADVISINHTCLLHSRAGFCREAGNRVYASAQSGSVSGPSEYAPAA